MSSIAAQFLKRTQDLKHPGFHRHMAILDKVNHAAQGIAIRLANEQIIRMAGSTATKVELMTAQVNNLALLNGVTSAVPGTREYTEYTGPTIQTGELAGLNSSHNLAGFSGAACARGGRLGKGKYQKRRSKLYTLLPAKYLHSSSYSKEIEFASNTLHHGANPDRPVTTRGKAIDPADPRLTAKERKIAERRLRDKMKKREVAAKKRAAVNTGK